MVAQERSPAHSERSCGAARLCRRRVRGPATDTGFCKAPWRAVLFKLKKPRLTPGPGQTRACGPASTTSPTRVRTAEWRRLPAVGVPSSTRVLQRGMCVLAPGTAARLSATPGARTSEPVVCARARRDFSPCSQIHHPVLDLSAFSSCVLCVVSDAAEHLVSVDLSQFKTVKCILWIHKQTERFMNHQPISCE